MSTEHERLAARLAAMRARVEAATPGPWRHRDMETNERLKSVWADTGVWSLSSRRNGAEICACRFGVQTRLNSEFIAHARADLPALLAVAEAAAEYRRATEYLFAVEQTHFQKAAIDEAARVESAAYAALVAALDALAGEAGG